MALLRDVNEIDFEEWVVPLPSPTAEDWLYRLWGIEHGVSSPRSHRRSVHPACAASAEWLQQLWGFSAT